MHLSNHWELQNLMKVKIITFFAVEFTEAAILID